MLKDSLGRDENRPCLHDTNSLLWFDSYSLNNPSVTRRELTGFIALRQVVLGEILWQMHVYSRTHQTARMRSDERRNVLEGSRF